MDAETLRLLLVEDEPGDAEMLLAVLAQAARARFDVTHLDRVSDACERLREETFHLALLDLTIPDEWGLDSLVRMTAQAPNLPVIIVAAAGDEPLALKAVDAGAAAWILKEKLDAEKVEKTILSTIQQHRRALAAEKPYEDGETGLYNESGFFRLAAKHLRLAAHAEKGLLLFHAKLDPFEPSARTMEDAARLLRETFRGSDLVARADGGEFIALAIVHPVDNSTEVVAIRFDELLYAHNARNEETLNFRFSMTRLQPGIESTIDDIRTAFRGMIETR
ncbi:MAG TPA: response regulator [Thermoanaerobaculia bacterium]